MKSLTLGIILLLLTIPAFAQLGNETITITTYYPSPHGVYGVLTMYPRDTVPNDPRKGDMYFNSVNDTLLIYVNDTAKWQPAGGSPVSSSGYDDGEVLYNFTDDQFYVYNATYKNYTQVDFGSGTSPIGPGSLAGAGSFVFICVGSVPCVLDCGTPETLPAICGPHDPASFYMSNAKCEAGWMVYNLDCHGVGPGTTNCSWTCQKLP
jgi:hypothetical protein